MTRFVETFVRVPHDPDVEGCRFAEVEARFDSDGDLRIEQSSSVLNIHRSIMRDFINALDEMARGRGL